MSPDPQQQLPPAPRLRLDYLDGLRGLAALYVVLHHAYYGLTLEGAALPHPVTLLTYWLLLGRSAVDIFIVLSGYCLMMPVVRAGAGGLPGGAVDFFKRRARRILPPYFAAMAVTLLAIALVPILHDTSHPNALWSTALPASTPGIIVSHLLLIHNFDPAWHSKIDYPMWSVATEWQIYFLFPLLLLPVRRRFGIWGAVGAAFAAGFLALILFPHRFGGVSPHFLGLFALGMAAADLNFSRTPALIRWRDRLPWSALAVTLLVLLVAASLLFHSKSLLLVPLKDVLVGAATAALLVSCTRHLARHQDENRTPGPARSPLVLRLMESRPAVALGAYSYSLYLVHAPVLAVCQAALRPLGLTPTVALALMLALGVPLALLSSYVFHLAFERPFLKRRATELTDRPRRHVDEIQATT